MENKSSSFETKQHLSIFNRNKKHLISKGFGLRNKDLFTVLLCYSVNFFSTLLYFIYGENIIIFWKTFLIILDIILYIAIFVLNLICSLRDPGIVTKDTLIDFIDEEHLPSIQITPKNEYYSYDKKQPILL